MTKQQKDSFIKNIHDFLDEKDAEGVEWLVFVMKTNQGRVSLASQKAPKSLKL